MTVEQWITSPGHFAQATRRIYDTDGTYAPRGSVGEICDYLPNETSSGGYLVVDFAETGPVLCWPNEIRPA
jgi:hypothetical protein